MAHAARLAPSYLLLAALTASPAAAQDKLLWGGLTPGPCAVGYRVGYHLDPTRQYDPEYPTDPARPPAPRPRPILVAVWYPAAATTAKPLAYREYLDVSSKDPRIAPFADRLTPFVREVVCEETVGKKPMECSPTQAAAFARLLATPTFAVKDAVAADGRFPVLLYHPGLGGAHEDNAVLFEYLASHGYAVVSGAYPMTSPVQVNIDWDLPRSFRDLEFLARHAAALPFADAARLAAMGHSYGGQAVVGWAAEPASAVRAVVTLDSGLEYVTLDHPGIEKLKAQLRAGRVNLRAATLRFASQSKTTEFAHLQPYLRYGPAYSAAVASLDHNDYLTHGAVRPALLADADKAKAVRLGYDRVCEHVRRFLDATLKDRSDGRDFLARSVAGEGLDAAFTLRYQAAVPAPPTARQLFALIRRDGLDKAMGIIRSAREDVEVGGDGIGGAGKLLIDAGELKLALALFTRTAEVFPESLPVYSNLGMARTLVGDRDGAKAAYRKAVELLPAATSDERTRARWKKELEQALRKVSEGK